MEILVDLVFGLVAPCIGGRRVERGGKRARQAQIATPPATALHFATEIFI
jgi:hypothetical protein